MVRKLKFHEKKLLKKVDFLKWDCNNQIHENRIMQKYLIQKREDYVVYNKLSRKIRELANKLKDTGNEDDQRILSTEALLNRLYAQGLIPAKTSLMLANSVSASSFCKRRLPYIVRHSHMAETMELAVKFVEQGHVRVGPHIVRDPAYLVPRALEDYITWAPGSKIKQKVEDFNGVRDDFEG